MNSNFFKSSLLLAGLMSATASVMAGPVERAAVVDDPAWVAHLDVDALRKSIVGAHILSELHKPEKELQLFVLQAALGSDLRTALHGITVYGVSPKPADGVALIYADINAERLTALARQAEDYQATSHGQHQIASWIDAKRREKEGGAPRTYAAIYQDRLVIFGQQESRVAEALDVLDKTKPGLAKSVFPKFGAGEPEVIQAAARQMDVPEGDPRAAILKLSKLVNLDVRESDGKMLGNLFLETKNEETARQVADVARGIIAIMGLQTDNPDAVKLSKSLSVEQTGVNATVKLNLPADDIVAAIKANAAKEAAKKAAADKAAADKAAEDKDKK